MQTMRLTRLAAGFVLLSLAACADADGAGSAAGTAIPAAGTSAGDAQSARAWGRLDDADQSGGFEYEVHVANAGNVPQLFARIGRDGVFSRVDPPGVRGVGKQARTVAEVFSDGCPEGAVAVAGGDVPIEWIDLYAVRKGEDNRHRLRATTSRAYVDWIAGTRKAFESGDATLDVHYATAAARVRGLCRLDSGDVVDYDLDIRPGLNLVRTRYDRFLMVGREAGSPGADKEAGITVRSEPVFPEDVRWFLEPVRERPDQSQGWGRLDPADAWFGTALDVRVPGMGDDMPLLGRIDAQGVFRPVAASALPEMPEWAGSLEDMVGVSGRCAHDPDRTSIAYDNPDARVIELDPYAYAEPSAQGVGASLVATNAPAYVNWLQDQAQRFAPGTAVMHVYYATEATGLRGRCPGEFDGSGTVFDIRLQPGLNLVRESFVSFRDTGADGEDGYAAWTGELQMQLASVPAFPDDMRWFGVRHQGEAPVADSTSAGASVPDWGRLEGNGLEATRLRIHANQMLDGDQLGPDIPLGETGPDGVFLFVEPPPPSADDALPVSEFFCAAGGASDNPSARVAEFTLGATATDGSRWTMVGASRPEFARWRGLGDGKVWTGDTELRVYHVTEAVQVHGACNGSFHHLNLSPGWNLVQAMVSGMEGLEGEGDPWPGSWSLERSYSDLPPEMRWYLFPDQRGVE